MGTRMDWWHGLILAVGALVAGVVNTLAGGGSLLTVPLLMLVGLEPNAANATNRIGVLTQSLTSSWTFRREGILGLSLSWKLLPSSLLGGAAGAWAATVVSNDAFRKAFGILMLPLGLLLLLRPKGWLRRRATKEHAERLLVPVFFLVGCYAGFIQAGYGLAALAALVLLGGHDLRYSNAVKVGLSAAITGLSVLIFAFRLDIHLWAGLVVAAAGGLGGYLGGIAAIRKGERWIRPVIFVMCVALSIRLLMGS